VYKIRVFRADETTKANFVPIEITSSGSQAQVGTTRASRAVLLRLTEVYAAAARVLCQPVWLELGTQEVPRRGDFQRIPRIFQRDHQRDHRSNESQSIVLRFNGCHLHRNLLDTTPFLCFCVGLVLKIFTRYCILWEVVSSGFVGVNMNDDL